MADSALDQALSCVKDPETFLRFVRLLVADRAAEVAAEKVKPSSPYGPGSKGWENGTIDAFLEAAVAWAESGAMGTPEDQASMWRFFADFLHAGKHFE